jgi:hypothetical protein
MICKNCGYDVPDGIEYCTACGEPMPKTEKTRTEDDLSSGRESHGLLTKKEFAKDYVPYYVKLSIHTGALLSYLLAAVYISIGLLFNQFQSNPILFIVFILLAAFSAGFQIKKSMVFAIITTALAALFTIYCFVVLHEFTAIWICAGVLGIYGTYHYQKLWNHYQKTEKLPPRIR